MCPHNVVDTKRDEKMSQGSKSAPVVLGLIKEQRANLRSIYDKAARRELVRLCGEPGVSISKTALVNGLNTNVLRCWLYENVRDPVWFNRRRSAEAPIESGA
jgi:transposase-like protein